MTEIRVVYYREPSGQVPLQRWLYTLPKTSHSECHKSIRRLQQVGQNLRLPHARRLPGNIYELRTRIGTLRYRIFYFWHSGTAVLSHGIAKKTSAIPQREIARALKRKQQFEQNPALHTQEITNA